MSVTKITFWFLVVMNLTSAIVQAYNGNYGTMIFNLTTTFFLLFVANPHIDDKN